MAYFTNAELNSYIEQTVSATDYQTWHDYVKARIENYCAQEFELATYTEERLTNNTVFLKHQPVKSVISVKDMYDNVVDPTKYDTYEWGIAFPYARQANTYSGWLGMVDNVDLTRKVTVNYTAGWDVIPMPIKQCALWMAKSRIVPSDVPTGIQSMSSGGVTISTPQANLKENRLTGNDYWDAVLNQYRIKAKVG